MQRSPPWRTLARAILLATGTGFGYYLAARLGYAFMIRPAGVAMWPPAGFLLAVLLLLPKRDWPVVLAAAFVGNFAADSAGQPPAIAAMGATANGVESLVAALTMRMLAGPRITLHSLREVIALVLGAAVASNALTSFAGSLVLGQSSGMSFTWGWFVWWAGDGLGMLLLTPVCLVWLTWIRSGGFSRIRPLVWLEAVALLVVIGGVASLVVSPETGAPRLIEGSRYLVFPLLFLAAIRFGMRGAATAVFLVGAIVAWEGAHAGGVFTQVGESASQQLMEVYGYLAVAALSGLVPAAVLSEREAARMRMRESEARFREMAEYIQDAFFVVDVVGGRTLYVSPAWASIWGRPIGDGYDSFIWHEAIHPDDRELIATAQAQTVLGTPSKAMFRIIHPDGAERWVQCRFFPVTDDHGSVIRLVGAATDITELRSAQDQQARSQRMEALGRLAGGVAHDFNNILTVIVTSCDFLPDLVSDEEPRQLIREIRAAGDRATELTRQLLTFSRKQSVTLSEFDVNDAVRQLTGMLRRLIRENLALTFELTDFPCTVKADLGQFEQVLVNLVVNARDAMPDGGQLTVRTALTELDEPLAAVRGEIQPGHYVTVDISDTGTGMTEEVKARIFEPFFTTKATGQGTGLGLATSFGIVARAKGHLTVYSEPGIGTTFRIYLPFAVPGMAAPTLEIEIPVRGGDETILLVEDDLDVRRVIVRLLTSLGYQVLDVADSEQALGMLEQHGDIALLFTDVVLKGMGGNELAKRAALLRPGLPVLFMSGYTEDLVLERLLDEPAARLLRKPFTRNRLARKIRQAIESAR